LHVPTQQSDVAAHDPPKGAHAGGGGEQLPPVQVSPPQHSASAPHAEPCDLHSAQTPLAHVPLQQSEEVLQASPLLTQHVRVSGLH
jgi:hypothetical protein